MVVDQIWMCDSQNQQESKTTNKSTRKHETKQQNKNNTTTYYKIESFSNKKPGSIDHEPTTRRTDTVFPTKQGTTASFPFVFTSHMSSLCVSSIFAAFFRSGVPCYWVRQVAAEETNSHPHKDCDPAAPKPPAYTQKAIDMRVVPQTTLHRHSPRKAHASFDRTQARTEGSFGITTCTPGHQPNTWSKKKMVNIFGGQKLLGMVMVHGLEGLARDVAHLLLLRE